MTDHFVEYWKRQQIIHRQHHQRLAQQAWRDVDRIVRALRQGYNVRNFAVWLRDTTDQLE